MEGALAIEEDRDTIGEGGKKERAPGHPITGAEDRQTLAVRLIPVAHGQWRKPAR